MPQMTINNRVGDKDRNGTGCRAKYPGIVVARLIVKGDVDTARDLARCYARVGWRVPELRAIIGACDYARSKYGAKVNWLQFV